MKTQRVIQSLDAQASLLLTGKLHDTKKQYENRLLGFAQGMLGSRTEAEDVVAETFLRLWNGLLAQTLRGKSDAELRCWLFQVTRNQCIDILRRSPPLSLFEQPDKGAMDDIRHLEGELYVEAVLKGQFTTDEIALITLWVDERLPMASIAERLGITIPAAKSRWYRARNRLRVILQTQYSSQGRRGTTAVLKI